MSSLTGKVDGHDVSMAFSERMGLTMVQASDDSMATSRSSKISFSTAEAGRGWLARSRSGGVQ